jgi:type IV pilus assembly protein PilC
MAFILTPGEFTRRAEFYHQLSQLTSAGIGVVQALEQIKRNPPSAEYRRNVNRLLEELATGRTVGESLRSMPDWLPEFDITLIEAGEKSGRIDGCFRMLGDYYSERSRTTRQVIVMLAYPAFLLHLLAAVMALVLFFWLPHLCLLPIAGLLVVYAAVFLMIYAFQSSHGENWRAFMESVLHRVPVLGSARRSLALGRLAAALEALISAGITIIEAWELAAKASGSVKLQRVVQAWRPRLQAGQTPAEALQASRAFPNLFTNQYAAGEISGKLDETLERMRDYYRDDGSRKVQITAHWVPIGIYLLVLITCGFFVVWFWITYYGKIWQAVGF